MKKLILVAVLCQFLALFATAQTCYYQDTTKQFFVKMRVPAGIAISSRERVAVTSCFTDTLYKRTTVKIWKKLGRFMEGRKPDDSIRAIGPQGAAFDTAGNLYVVQTGRSDSNILIFNDSLRLIKVIDNSTGVLRWTRPRGITIDGAGSLYVVSDDSIGAGPSFTVYPNTGKLIKIVNPLGSHTRSLVFSGLGAPRDVAINDSFVYVTESRRNMVRKYNIRTLASVDSAALTGATGVTSVGCRTYGTSGATVQWLRTDSLRDGSRRDILVQPSSDTGKLDVALDRQKDLFFTVNDLDKVLYFRGVIPGTGAAGIPYRPVCIGTSLTLGSDTTGTWLSTSPTVATVDSAGRAFAVSTGTTTIYHISSTTDTFYVLVERPLSGIGSIYAELDGVNLYGSARTCLWNSRQLYSTGPVSHWISTDPAKLLIDGGGNAWPRDTGTVVVIARLGNSCGYESDSFTLIIEPSPTIAPIVGPDSICCGATVTLTDSVRGGFWTSSDSLIARVDRSTGRVFGVSRGQAEIMYSVSNSCETLAVSHLIVVKESPRVSPIRDSSRCVGAPAFVFNDSAGGIWYGATPIAGSGGLRAQLTAPSRCRSAAFVMYKKEVFGCGADSATTVVTADDYPTLVSAEVPQRMCVGDRVPLLDTVRDCYSIIAHPSYFSYSYSGRFFPYGYWGTSSSAVRVSSGSSGSTSLSLEAVSPGIAVVYYYYHNRCSGAWKQDTVYVGGGLYGRRMPVSRVCLNDSITITPLFSGGSWRSATGLLPISAAGRVFGSRIGVDTMVYLLIDSCGRDSAFYPVEVVDTAAVSAGFISGSTSICAGTSDTLTASGASGGTWSSTTGALMFSRMGIVYGFWSGRDTALYIVSTACRSDTASFPMVVLPLARPGLIIGGRSICMGTGMSFWSTGEAGSWRTVSGSASISTIGYVTGTRPGLDTIVYTVVNSCNTDSSRYPVEVFPAPSAGTITGSSIVCVGDSVRLSSSVAGGTWGRTTGASGISSTGWASGIRAGLDTISYYFTNVCGIDTAMHPINVATVPVVSISGVTSVCPGSVTSFAASPSGGRWSSRDTTGRLDTAGVFTATRPGLAWLHYYASNTCGADSSSYGVIIRPWPDAGTLTAPAFVCDSLSDTLSSTVAGGVWGIRRGNAAVTASGVVTGITPGRDTAFYIVTTTCGRDTNSVALNILPYVVPRVSVTASDDSLCAGDTVTYTATSVNGGSSPIYNWLVLGAYTATGPTFYYTPALGDVITCMLTSSAQCAIPLTVTSSDLTMYVTPSVTPTVSIISVPADSMASIGERYNYYAMPTYGGTGITYQWYVNGAPVSGATTNWYSRDIYSTDSVWCAITSDAECRTTSAAASNVIVTFAPSLSVQDAVGETNEVAVFPNPNNGAFSLRASIGSGDRLCRVEVRDVRGNLVHSQNATAEQGLLETNIATANKLAAGVYMVRVTNGTISVSVPFIVQ